MPVMASKGTLAMPTCRNCGHSNAEDARFCSNCGAALHPDGGTGGAPAASPGETSTITIQGVDTAESATEKSDALTAADQQAVDALPPGSALLVVRRGPNSGSRFLLDSDTTTAGRHPSSDIFLDDVTVSRRHAEFLRSGDTFSVRDVGSLNGTYVNRERIDDSALQGGDEVQIGKYRLVFYPSQQGGAGGERG
jgi:pSer/pThr/pTyr-binding forkhead associated (FHA) protein